MEYSWSFSTPLIPMKFHSIAPGLFLLSVLAAPAFGVEYAPAPPPAPPPDGAPAWTPPGDDEPKTPLAKDMHKIASAVRKLRSKISDPANNASSLGLVAQIRAAAVDASSLTPAFAADQPADKRADFVADFQSDMKEFVGKVDILAAALTANDNAAAAADFKALLTAEKAGHKEFRKPRPPQ
jgi:soluble cytochrome b562